MKLYFHHIPKTGGLSVIKSLKNAGLSHVRHSFHHYPYGNSDEHQADLVSSHWYLLNPEHQAFGRKTILWLRHPVDILYSGLNFYASQNITFGDGSRLDPNYQPKTTRDIILSLLNLPSVNAMIDAILSWQYNPTSIFPRPWFNFIPMESIRWDFIGQTDHMATDIDRLGLYLNLKLTPAYENPTRVDYDKTYRRDDLCNFLWSEIVLYERLLENTK